MKNLVKVLWLAVFCMGGCSGYNEQPVVSTEEIKNDGLVVPLELPATFSGQIPCPDCERQDAVLKLRADHLYQLRKIEQAADGTAKSDVQMGRWRYSPEGRLIILGKQKGTLKTYAIEDENRLRFVSWEGTDSSNQVQYELVRSTEQDPFEDMIKIRGMFRIQGDEVTLAECSTGSVFQIDQAADLKTTAQAYLNVPHPYGEAVLVSFNGRLITRANREVMVIDHFRRFYPNSDCDGNQIQASLTGTYWRLHALEGKVVSSTDGLNAPFLLFDSDKTATGFGGCNKLDGTYLLQGDVFLFKRNAAARIACPENMETENALIKALEESETYRVSDDTLELIDQHNQVRLQFQAGP